MIERKMQVKEKTLTLNDRCSSYARKIQYFDLIPLDLIIKILSKLTSGKSLGKCRCVSKLWSSIITRSNYNQLFPTKSPEPPRFLFTVMSDGKLLFYTSPQPQNPDNDLSIVATRHHTATNFYQVSRPIQGLVCCVPTKESSKEVVICNPITGQSVTLPTRLTTTGIFQSKSYLGYDPIDKQFKVLLISWVSRGTEETLYLEHQVLTLENGSENLLWRKIECCIPYSYTLGTELCINGVSYYKVFVDSEHMIRCFDIRSERIYFLSVSRFSTLINYKGKLGAVDNHDPSKIVVWVLEDSEKQKWSNTVYETPLQCRCILDDSFVVAGFTDTGEIVLRPVWTTKVPFDIFYYNLEKKIVVKVRVEVPPFETPKCFCVNLFPNYVEDVKLM